MTADIMGIMIENATETETENGSGSENESEINNEANAIGIVIVIVIMIARGVVDVTTSGGYVSAGWRVGGTLYAMVKGARSGGTVIASGRSTRVEVVSTITNRG